MKWKEEGVAPALSIRPLEKVCFLYAPCAVLGAGFSKTRRRGRRLEHLCKRSIMPKVSSFQAVIAKI